MTRLPGSLPTSRGRHACRCRRRSPLRRPVFRSPSVIGRASLKPGSKSAEEPRAARVGVSTRRHRPIFAKIVDVRVDRPGAICLQDLAARACPKRHDCRGASPLQPIPNCAMRRDEVSHLCVLPPEPPTVSGRRLGSVVLNDEACEEFGGHGRLSACGITAIRAFMGEAEPAGGLARRWPLASPGSGTAPQGGAFRPWR